MATIHRHPEVSEIVCNSLLEVLNYKSVFTPSPRHHLYNMPIYSNPIVNHYTTLHHYTMPLYYAPPLCPYTMPLHYASTLCPSTMPLHYAPTLCPYTMPLHYAPTLCPSHNPPLFISVLLKGVKLKTSENVVSMKQTTSVSYCRWLQELVSICASWYVLFVYFLYSNVPKYIILSIQLLYIYTWTRLQFE